MGRLPLIFWWGTILLVIPIVIPVTLGGGERSKVIVKEQKLLFLGGHRRCSRWCANDADLHNACTKRVNCSTLLALADQVVSQLETEDHSGAIEAPHVIRRFDGHPVNIICCQRVDTVGFSSSCQRFCSFGCRGRPCSCFCNL